MPESASGTLHGWQVEARSCGDPITFGKQIFDGEWRTVYFSRVPEELGVGVRNPSFQEPWLSFTNRYTFEAVQALRWWLIAELHMKPTLETRLARSEIKYSVTTQRKGADHTITFDDYRYVDNDDLTMKENGDDE